MLVCFAACLLGPVLAHAGNFPTKPIRLVVPVAAGGSADMLGRVLAQQLSELYGQPVVVENKPGASGHIGSEAVAKTSPDGYTLLVGLQPVQAAFAIYPDLKYDPSTDLDTLSIIGTFPSVLLVNPSVQASSVQDFIKLAKSEPGVINFGSAGPGSATHLAGELFMADAKVKLTHIPYRGSSAASTDLMGEQIQAMFENLPTATALVKSKRVKALGVTGHLRASSLPDIPTVAEQGLPDYEFQGWYTIAAPTGMDPGLRRKISADIDRIVHSSALASRWAELGVTPVGGTAETSNAFVKREAQKYTKLIHSAHLGM
ncbi:tripartite tricarboxylate transporter substrate binding protein [Bordetella sp. BOR01]|uniref:Bug family tripartite tricarboxylate transporter substrate binding protein n=1 Tax=Bordetella sp. BOR01 TaxID=2854779 RepID=UPI0021085703|nr:tripartite tricarboxylate transporter substrate binding protein [Bordetella sp. BOR01]